MSPTPTAVYNLLKADPNDMYDVLVVNGNLDKIDAALVASGGGTNLSVITSTTRPASPVANRFYWETDTRRLYLYTGSTWVQISGPPAPVILTPGSSVNTNAALGRRFRVNINAASVMQGPTNGVDCQEAVWEFLNGTASAQTVTLQTGVTDSFEFGDATGITALTPVASGKMDILAATFSMATRRWRVLSYAKGYAAA